MPSGLGGEAAVAPLREAKASLSLATRLRLSYRLFAFAASLSTLALIAGVLGGAHLFIVFVAIATAFQTALALRQRGKAQRATGDASEALERAWLAAAEDVASHAKNGVTVAELASRLKVDAVKAEKLLTQLAVNDRTRIDVDDDAEVRYSVSPDIDVSKVRVDTTEDKFRALEEAELDEAEAKKLATPAFPNRSSR
jgi:phosphomannomutase